MGLAKPMSENIGSLRYEYISDGHSSQSSKVDPDQMCHSAEMLLHNLTRASQLHHLTRV